MPTLIHRSLVLTTVCLLSVAARASEDCRVLFITPDVVALARDDRAHLRPLRRAAGEALVSRVERQGANWQPPRESVIVPLALIHDANGVRMGPGAAWLPKSLRTLLKTGARFETTRDPARASRFSLWMIAQPEGHRRRGRTGVLLENGRPIVVANPRTGAEYVIELKGAGLPTGGFARSDEFRALQGGLWDGQGGEEFDRLNELSGFDVGDGVKGLGYARFRGPFGGQDLLWRLTPGNLRASYEGPRALERDPARLPELLTTVGQQVADLIADGHYAYTHPENFVVDRTGSRAWLTDLLDVLPLRHLPRVVENVWMDETRAVVATLGIPELFAGYDRTAHWPAYWRTVVEQLIARGVVPAAKGDELLGAPNFEVAAVAVLKAGLAARIFHDRVRRGYDPLDDPDLARAVNTPCAEPVDAREHGRVVKEMFASYAAPSTLPVSTKLLSRMLDEVEHLARGVVTYREWLQLPITSSILAAHIELSAGESYLKPEDDGWNDLIRSMLGSGMPGLFAYTRHLERELRLLKYARASDPTDQRVTQNLREVLDRISSFEKMDLDQLIDRMCDDRAAFRADFKLPYHRR